MKRIDSCRKVFMSEKTADIHKELDGFCAYHEDQFSYLERLDAYNASVGGVTKDRVRYVQEKMESFGLKFALVEHGCGPPCMLGCRGSHLCLG